MELTLPITISLATLLVSVGGNWFVTQRRIKEIEVKLPAQDAKIDKVISEIGGMKVDMAKMQGSIDVVSEKANALDDKLDASVKSLNDKIDFSVKSLNDKIDANAKALNDKTDANAKALNDKIDANAKAVNEKLDLLIQSKIK